VQLEITVTRCTAAPARPQGLRLAEGWDSRSQPGLVAVLRALVAGVRTPRQPPPIRTVPRTPSPPSPAFSARGWLAARLVRLSTRRRLAWLAGWRSRLASMVRDQPRDPAIRSRRPMQPGKRSRLVGLLVLSLPELHGAAKCKAEQRMNTGGPREASRLSTKGSPQGACAEAFRSGRNHGELLTNDGSAHSHLVCMAYPSQFCATPHVVESTRAPRNHQSTVLACMRIRRSGHTRYRLSGADDGAEHHHLVPRPKPAPPPPPT